MEHTKAGTGGADSGLGAIPEVRNTKGCASDTDAQVGQLLRRVLSSTPEHVCGKTLSSCLQLLASLGLGSWVRAAHV